MNEDEQKAAEIAEAEAAKKAEEEANANHEGESDEDKAAREAREKADLDKKIDYQAELKKEREAREKAEKALAEGRYKFKRKDKEADEETEESEEDENKPLTKSEVQKLLAENSQRTVKELQGGQIAAIARKLAGSDAEAQLIVEIHKNRTFPSHLSLDEQLEEAYVIANRKKIMAETNEVRRALKGKEAADNDAASDHNKGFTPNAKPNMSAQDTQALKDAGWTWNGTAKQWEKKLGNGNTIVKDPKTGQVSEVKRQK